MFSAISSVSFAFRLHCVVLSVGRADEPWIALIQRGDCTFTTKIENAIRHGAKAVIVYTTEDKDMVTMAHGGTSPIISPLSYFLA